MYGIMPPEAYRAAKPVSATDNGNVTHEPVPFFAAGVSFVSSVY